MGTQGNLTEKMSKLSNEGVYVTDIKGWVRLSIFFFRLQK